MADIVYAVQNLYVSVDSVTKKHIALDQKLAEIDEKLNQRVTPNNSQDSSVLKRLSDVEERQSHVKEQLRNLTDEFRSFKASTATSLNLLETSMASKMEQYVSRLVKERCTFIHKDILSQTKRMIEDTIVDVQPTMPLVQQQQALQTQETVTTPITPLAQEDPAE